MLGPNAEFFSQTVFPIYTRIRHLASHCHFLIPSSTSHLNKTYWLTSDNPPFCDRSLETQKERIALYFSFFRFISTACRIGFSNAEIGSNNCVSKLLSLYFLLYTAIQIIMKGTGNVYPLPNETGIESRLSDKKILEKWAKMPENGGIIAWSISLGKPRLLDEEISEKVWQKFLQSCVPMESASVNRRKNLSPRVNQMRRDWI